MFRMADDVLEIGKNHQQKLMDIVERVEKDHNSYFPLCTKFQALEEDIVPLDPDELELKDLKLTTGKEPPTKMNPRKPEPDKELQIYKYKKEFLEMLEKHNVLVVSGDTGCGKTTKLPQFVLEFYQEKNQGGKCNIVCTQPRRLSAIMAAKRVASECGQRLGISVGYQVRLDKRLPASKTGAILYCTTGILLQRLKSKNNLKDFSHVFLDEVHERSIETDFLMIIMRDLVRCRPDLKVVLMSASVDQQRFLDYFGGCPFELPRMRKYSIEEYYLEDLIGLVEEEAASRSSHAFYRYAVDYPPEEQKKLELFYNKLLENKKLSPEQVQLLKEWPDNFINFRFIGRLIRDICLKDKKDGGDHHMGAILVFLPGWKDIQALKAELEKNKPPCPIQIHPLHSMVVLTDELENALEKSESSEIRKIILSTNIAETSMTIPDVVHVIDCGKANIACYNADKDFTTLSANWISKANAIQRAGRAGRVKNGFCYRLFTRARYELMAEHIRPEICHMRLELLCLRIKNLKLGPIIPFLEKALDSPPQEIVENSIGFLRKLDALNDNEELTPLGWHLSKLPLDPQIGKMIILGAIFSCLDPILTIAASLSEKDVFIYTEENKNDVEAAKRSLGADLNSDHLLVAKVFQEYEGSKDQGLFIKQHYLSKKNIKNLARFRIQLAKDLLYIGFLKNDNIKDERYNQNNKNEHVLRAVVCAGLYPNIAMASSARNSGSRQAVKLINENTGFIHKKSIVCQGRQLPQRWVVFYHLMEQKDILLHDITCVNPLALILFSKDFRVRNNADRALITVDGWAQIPVTIDTAACLQKYRGTLRQVLDYRFQVPGTTDWSHEGKVLKPMIELFKDHKDRIPKKELDEMLDFA